MNATLKTCLESRSAKTIGRKSSEQTAIRNEQKRTVAAFSDYFIGSSRRMESMVRRRRGAASPDIADGTGASHLSCWKHCGAGD